MYLAQTVTLSTAVTHLEQRKEVAEADARRTALAGHEVSRGIGLRHPLLEGIGLCGREGERQLAVVANRSSLPIGVIGRHLARGHAAGCPEPGFFAVFQDVIHSGSEEQVIAPSLAEDADPVVHFPADLCLDAGLINHCGSGRFFTVNDGSCQYVVAGSCSLSKRFGGTTKQCEDNHQQG